MEKHPMTVVLMKEEHERLVRVAQADDRPPARLARMLINEGLKKRERVIEDKEDEGNEDPFRETENRNRCKNS